MTKRVTIIEESGVNHNGDIDLAVELVGRAARAGADSIKFQTFKASTLGVGTMNIGDHQLGRILAPSVYYSSPNTAIITNAITKEVSKESQINARDAINPYGMSNATGEILSLIKVNAGPFPYEFYDLERPK
jgi:hypothetical protein